MESPGDEMPSSSFFERCAVGERIPDSWIDLLPCSQQVRASCLELRRLVSEVPGPKDPVTMLRFLYARGKNLEKAAEMYKTTMKWREEQQLVRGFEDGSLDDSLHRRLDNYWKVIGLLGRDLDGFPVLWERLGQAHSATLLPIPDEFGLKHEVYTNVRLLQAIEELILRNQSPKCMYMTVVVDLAGLGIQHLNLALLRKFHKNVRISQDHFPELVRRAIVVRAPRIFTRIWAIVQHFFDEGTRKKIRIAGDADTIAVLSEWIDKSWIPEGLGGDLRQGSSPMCAPFIAAGGPVPSSLVETIKCEYSQSGKNQ